MLVMTPDRTGSLLSPRQHHTASAGLGWCSALLRRYQREEPMMSKSKRARRHKARVTVTKASVRKFIPLHKSGKSKQDHVLRLLRGAHGATIENVMEATGWQPHSVRAFFAAVVRKKLGLTLLSEKTDGERIYRVAGTTARAESAASTGT